MLYEDDAARLAIGAETDNGGDEINLIDLLKVAARPHTVAHV